MAKLTIIELTRKDAERFKIFQEHYDDFVILINAKIFETTNGSIKLHFNKQGKLKLVEKTGFTYVDSRKISTVD